MPVIPGGEQRENFNLTVQPVSYSPATFGVPAKALSDLGGQVQNMATDILERRMMAEAQLFQVTERGEIQKEFAKFNELNRPMVDDMGFIWRTADGQSLPAEEGKRLGAKPMRYQDYASQEYANIIKSRRKNAPTEFARDGFDIFAHTMLNGQQLEDDSFISRHTLTALDSNIKKGIIDEARNVTPGQARTAWESILRRKDDYQNFALSGRISYQQAKLYEQSAGSAVANSYIDTETHYASNAEEAGEHTQRLVLLKDILEGKVYFPPDFSALRRYDVDQAYKEGRISDKQFKEYKDKGQRELFVRITPETSFDDDSPLPIQSGETRLEDISKTYFNTKDIVDPTQIAEPKKISLDEALEIKAIDQETYRKLAASGKKEVEVAYTKKDQVSFNERMGQDIEGLAGYLTAEEKIGHIKKIDLALKRINGQWDSALDRLNNDFQANALSNGMSPELMQEKQKINEMTLKSNKDLDYKVRVLLSNNMHGLVGNLLQTQAQMSPQEMQLNDKEIERIMTSSISEAKAIPLVGKSPKMLSFMSSPSYQQGERLRMKEIYLRQREQLLEERQKDPGAYVTKYFKGMRDLSLAALSNSPQAVQKFSNQFEAYQAQIGIPVSQRVKTNPEMRAHYGLTFKSLPPSEQAQVLTQMQAAYGKDMQKVMNELIADKSTGLKDTNILIASWTPATADGLVTKQEFLKYGAPGQRKAIEDLYKSTKPTKSVEDIDQMVTKKLDETGVMKAFLADSSYDRAQAFESIRQSISLMTMDRLVSKDAGIDPEAVVDKAVEESFLRNFHVIKQDKSSIMVPRIYNGRQTRPDQFERFNKFFKKKETLMEFIRQGAFRIPDSFVNGMKALNPQVSQKEVHEAFANKIINNGVFYTNEGQNGLVLNMQNDVTEKNWFMADRAGSNFIPVQDSEGGAFTVSFDKIEEMDQAGAFGEKNPISKKVERGIEAVVPASRAKPKKKK